MTRITVLLLAALTLTGLAWSKGKPGGGGGGGAGDPLPGSFYVYFETPVYNPYAGGVGEYQGAFVIAPDGTLSQALDDLGLDIYPGEPSYDTHAGLRAFLEVRDVYGYGALPDGSQRNVLVARLEDGSVHELTTAGDDIRIVALSGANPSGRWGKDDSFVSYPAIVWDTSGTASTHIFAGPVDWDTSGVPTFSASPAAVVDGTLATESGKAVSSLGGHDWSPDGSEVVYRDGGDIKVATFGTTTSHATITNGGDDPRWSPAADSTRIVFAEGYSIFLVDSDGQNLATLAAGSSKTRYGEPAWSPAGNHVAFLKFKDIKIQGQWNYTSDLYVRPADGSASASNITGDISDRVRCRGWR